MTRNLFILADVAGPSSRWLQAFPDGKSATLDVAVSTREPVDVIWLSTASSGWQGQIQTVLGAFSTVKLIVVSNLPNLAEAQTALSVGAHGYCHAWCSPMQMREVEQVVIRGGYWLGPELMARIVGVVARRKPLNEERIRALSEREAEVARHVTDGRSNKEIALLLNITERTVKAHLGAIFDKLGVRNRLQLALRLTGDTTQSTDQPTQKSAGNS